MVLIAVVAGISGVLSSLGDTALEEVARTVRRDVVITADRPLANELAALDEVDAASEEVTLPFEIRWLEDDGEVWYEHTDGLAADPATFAETRDIEITAGDLTDLHGTTVAVSPSAFAPMKRLPVDPAIRLATIASHPPALPRTRRMTRRPTPGGSHRPCSGTRRVVLGH